MRTKQLATQTALNPHYERRELLDEPVRSPGGYRVGPDEALGRVRFIKRAQRDCPILHEPGAAADGDAATELGAAADEDTAPDVAAEGVRS